MPADIETRTNAPLDRRAFGQQVEALALAFLQDQGLALVQRNFQRPSGEIDLIMRDRTLLVFVEVRYRSSERFGGAAASITAAKKQKLIATAQAYLQRHARYQPAACRFDVVLATGSNRYNGALRLHWIKDAFSA